MNPQCVCHLKCFYILKIQLIGSDKNNILLIAMSRIQQTLKAYTYNASKPIVNIHPFVAYEAQSKENALQVTIKLYKKSDTELANYLLKMKAAASQYVVKIYEVIHEPESHQILVIQQSVPYGTLAHALSKKNRFEDEDAITVSKLLLNGHIDMLRSGVCWSGNQADIDITQGGIKLSWNNSMIYSENNPNPFPDLITRIAVRKEQANCILPFPPNKMIADLIKVSRQNASEMSLHPLLKKRDKVFKKKGKKWLAIKQYKVKGQYVPQLTYTGVSKEHGLIRIKIFQKGVIDAALIKIYQTRSSFTRLIDYYEEGNQFITISDYANDGSVQSYVKRLKNSTILLKENHIQFIFFSLIEPLKFINVSPVGSLNLLHIRNVFIEDGIPKIGEIIPITQPFREVLLDKADVPDFYHHQFKKSPDSKDPKYDTYSLGVLLYKLMYTEYPIFPEGKVHIPTTPAYKKTLKDALLLFFNRGGNLSELQNQLQVSDDIKNQVKKNEKLLNLGTTNKNGMLMEDVQNVKENYQYHSQLSVGLEEQKKINESDRSCTRRLWTFLNTRSKDHQGKYRKLHTSNFAFYRKCTVSTLIILFYFLAFFLPYLIGFFNLMYSTRLFFSANVSVLGQTNKFIITDYNEFLNAVSGLGTLTSTDQLTNNLSCLMDNKGSNYDFIRPSSPHWNIYLILSLVTMIIILVLKMIQTSQFSIARMAYHYYDDTIDGMNESRFAISSYVFFQLWYFMGLYAFFYLYNIIFLEQHTPCFGGSKWSALTKSLFQDRMQFSLRYLVILMGTFALGIVSFIHLTKVYSRLNYNSLFNPICIYTPLYISLFIMMRIGADTHFVPSFISNNEKIIGSSYINFIGYFPQFLYIAQFLIQLLVNLIFYKYMDQKIQSFVTEESMVYESK